MSSTGRNRVALRHLVTCLDRRRVPLNAEERAKIAGEIPYWGANGVVGHVNRALFDETLVLLGEDGAPFFEPGRDVAFLVSEPVWVNNHIHVLRPTGIDPRFLAYSLNAVDYSLYITGSTRDKLTQDDLRRIEVWLPERDEQRRISDFLDAATRRIEKLASTHKRLREAVLQRRWSLFQDLVEKVDAPLVPMRRVIEFITDGPFGSAFSSSDYSDTGAAVVRLGNIGFGEYRHHEQAFIPLKLYRNFLRHEVLAGNLLIAGLGDARNHAGRACVAPDLGPAIVKGKCFCARVNSRVANAHFLSLLLSSPIGRQAMESRGSTRSMINLEVVKSAVLPLPGLKDQARIVEVMRSADRLQYQIAGALAQQEGRLAERRQALITAAVTGQVDVSTARGVDV